MSTTGFIHRRCHETTSWAFVVSFSDGYKWLIHDPILGRLCDGEPQQGSSCNGAIQGIEGAQAFYYHKLGTSPVCVVPKLAEKSSLLGLVHNAGDTTMPLLRLFASAGDS